MLDVLKKGFNNAKLKLQGKRRLNEENIREACENIKISLLEADVEFSVVNIFIDRVIDKAIGEIVNIKVKHKDSKIELSPGDHFIRICQDELEGLMGPVDTSLDVYERKPSVVMTVGLQGSGKTTTCGKLANYLKEKNSSVLLVAADVYRPAAREQLRVIGDKLDIPVYTKEHRNPVKICKKAIDYAKNNDIDTVIIDTAGRLVIDDDLMKELANIEKQVKPNETLLVCDAMIGQDSVRIAKEFSNKILLTGFILTKLDGDTRGGAALSIKEVTGKPIKFLGMGEALTNLEEFRPEGLASRILGFGDVVGLVRDFEKVVDEKKAEEDAKRMLQGQFNLNDFLEQIKMIKNMGPLQDIFEKMPFFGGALPEGVVLDDKELVKVEALINSMTKAERSNPQLISGRRADRIAKGAGSKTHDLSELLKKYHMMKKMLAGFSGGLTGGMPGIKQLKKLKKLSKMTGMDISGMMDQLPSMDIPQKEIVQLSEEEKRKLKNKRKRRNKRKK